MDAHQRCHYDSIEFLKQGEVLAELAVAGSRIDVKRLIVLSPIKNKGEVRLDNKIHIFGARRTNVTGLNARELRARNWNCQNLSKVAISASKNSPRP